MTFSNIQLQRKQEHKNTYGGADMKNNLNSYKGILVICVILAMGGMTACSNSSDQPAASLENQNTYKYTQDKSSNDTSNDNSKEENDSSSSYGTTDNKTTESTTAKPQQNTNSYSNSTHSDKYDYDSYDNGYDEGYEDVYENDDYDWDRYYEDQDYADGVDDAMDEEDW